MTDDDARDLYAQIGALTLALRQVLRTHPELCQRLLAYADTGDLGDDGSERGARNAVIYRETIRELAGPTG